MGTKHMISGLFSSAFGLAGYSAPPSRDSSHHWKFQIFDRAGEGDSLVAACRRTSAPAEPIACPQNVVAYKFELTRPDVPTNPLPFFSLLATPTSGALPL